MSEGSEPSRWRNAWEEFVDRVSRGWKYGLISAIVVAAAGAFLLSPLGNKFFFWSYDSLFRMRGFQYRDDTELIYLDEKSHVEMGVLRYDLPWPRQYHAKLLHLIEKQHPKAVVFDVVFSGPSGDTNSDRELAEALHEYENVFLAADYTPVRGHENAFEFYPPYKPFLRAVGGLEHLASDYVYPDADTMVRRHLPCDIHDDRIASEGWTVASYLKAPVTQDTNNHYLPFFINYYGPGPILHGTSLSTVYNGDIPTNLFTDKVVFIGGRSFTKYDGERKDEYLSPFSYLTPNEPYMPGVEMQAMAFINIFRNERLFRVEAHLELAIFIGVGILAGFGFMLLRPLASTIAAAVSVGLILLISYLLFVYGYHVLTYQIMVLVQLPLAWVASVAINSVQLYVEKQKVEQSLSLYLSPKLVKKFAKNPKLLKPGAEKQLLTILFSDIAGFTTISEGMDSDDLAKAMNDYFQTAVHNCIHSTEGTVVKYIGDAIFAFWNAPDLQSDHAYRSCEAALLFRDQPAQFMNKKELITRIGLHTGVANVGNFGSMTRVDYTALGENINLASRMEGLNKYLGTVVLITGETQEVAGPRIITRYLGLFRLKGFERAVRVFELVGRIEDESKTRDLRDRFSKALAVVPTRNFDLAEAAFNKVLELSPKDGPTAFYLEQIAEWRTEELPADWKGEVTLKDK